MVNIEFKILECFDDKLISEIKKLEIENLGKDAAINEWQIPLIIRYGKFIIAQNESKKIIGVCEAVKSWCEENTAFIHSFYIVKDYRNKKIGKKLLEFAILNFKEDKIKTIKLTVSPENSIAITLYKNAGFEIKTLYENEYGRGVDRFLMELTV